MTTLVYEFGAEIYRYITPGADLYILPYNIMAFLMTPAIWLLLLLGRSEL